MIEVQKKHNNNQKLQQKYQYSQSLPQPNTRRRLTGYLATSGFFVAFVGDECREEGLFVRGTFCDSEILAPTVDLPPTRQFHWMPPVNQFHLPVLASFVANPQNKQMAKQTQH